MKFWHVGIISFALFVTACAKQEPAVVTAHEETPDTALTEMDAPPAASISRALACSLAMRLASRTLGLRFSFGARWKACRSA